MMKVNIRIKVIINLVGNPKEANKERPNKFRLLEFVFDKEF